MVRCNGDIKKKMMTMKEYREERDADMERIRREDADFRHGIWCLGIATILFCFFGPYIALLFCFIGIVICFLRDL